MSDKPLTAEVLADALGCFHNAAIGALHDQCHPIACIVAGVNAVANRLREHAAEADPVEAIEQKGEP